MIGVVLSILSPWHMLGDSLSLNLVCELTRRWRPSATDTVPNVHAKCARRISNGANCGSQPDAVPKQKTRLSDHVRLLGGFRYGYGIILAPV